MSAGNPWRRGWSLMARIALVPVELLLAAILLELLLQLGARGLRAGRGDALLREFPAMLAAFAQLGIRR